MQSSKTISLLLLVTGLVITIPMGYTIISVQAQILPSSPSPAAPSLAVKAPTVPKRPAATVTPTPTPTLAPVSAFKVDVILFGINNKTGSVVTYVTANNQTRAVALNATDENVKHENSTGVAEVFFTFPDLKLKVGDKFQACNILVKDSNIVCATGLKSPLNKTESVNILVSGPSATSNKS